MTMHDERGQGARRPHGEPCNDEQRSSRLSGASETTPSYRDRFLQPGQPRTFALYCCVMDNTRALPPGLRPRHAAGIGISLAVHALLLAMWQMSRPVPAPDDWTPEAMVLRLLPAPAPEPAPAPQDPVAVAAPRALAGSHAPSAARKAPAPMAAPAPAMQAAVSEQDAAEPEPAVPGEAPAPPASGSMLERARAIAGGADRAMRKEHPTRGIVAPVVTPQMKLQKGIVRANELAPNKWYEAPKTEEVLDPSHYDRRRYRIVGARGTYCVTYESHHAPDGLDTMRDGIKPKKTTCDSDWSPPTAQKWN